MERNVTYTPKVGLVVSTPKTSNSISNIPLMPGILRLLIEYKAEVEGANQGTDLAEAFVFAKEGDLLAPRTPDSLTRHLKRFMTMHSVFRPTNAS